MNEQPFHAFLQLIKLDDFIRLSHNKKGQLEAELKALQDERIHLEYQLQQAENGVRDAQKKVNDLELEAQTIDERAQEKKKKLDTLTTYKEIQSLQNEINKLHEVQHKIEQGVIAAWNALETAQTQCEQKNHDVSEKIQQLNEKAVSLQDTINQLQKDIDQEIAIRPERMQSVPAEWLEIYQTMASRVPDPVVEMIDTSCGACYYHVPEQDAIRARRRALVQCKGCFRLLYDPKAMDVPLSTEES